MGIALAALLLAQAGAPTPVINAVEVRLPVRADRRLLDQVPELIVVRRAQPFSRRTVQRSVENLFATGRFADVVVEAREEPQGLAIIFELTPVPRVAEVYTEGNVALPRAALVQASAMSVGQPYWPEEAIAAAGRVAEVYRARGYQEVVVEPLVDVTGGGASVGFSITEGQPTRLKSIVAAGDPGLSLSEVEDALGLKVGDILDRTQVEKGVERLRERLRTKGFYRAQVDEVVIEAGGRLLVPLRAGPVYRLRFEGNRVASDAALTAVAGYDPQEPLEPSVVRRLAGNIERFYRLRGFHDVSVTPVEARQARPSAPGAPLEAAWRFLIEEGPLVRLVRRHFDGNRAVSDAELTGVLRRAVEAAAGPPASLEVRATADPLQLEGRHGPIFGAELPAPPPETILDEPSLVEAARAMGALYRERGYMTATVTLAAIERVGAEAAVRFAIVEGPRTAVRTIEVKGLPPGMSGETGPLVPGSVFSAGALERLRGSLVRELGRRGYLFAAVEGTYRLGEGGRTADVTVTVASGPEVKVRAVVPVGNERTAGEVLLGQSLLKEGGILDAEALYRTQNNLLGLGVFRTVQVEMLSPERAERLKTVLLRVRERPRVLGEIGVGYFLAEGPRLVFDLEAPNLGGRAVNFISHGQVNIFALSGPALGLTPGLVVDLSDLPILEQIGGRLNASVQSKGLLPGGLGLRLDLLGERVFRPQFRFNRVAAVPTIDWTTAFEIRGVEWLSPKLVVALQYEVEWSNVTRAGSVLGLQLPPSIVDQERLRFRFGTFALQTVRLSPTLDLRDSALNPRRGVLLQAAGDITGALSAIDENGQSVVVNFLKLSALATGYVPLGPLVLALSVRGGSIFPLAPGSSTPPVKRFFLGGATSMRGFNEDQLIAEDVRAQYRGEVRDCRILAVQDGCTSAAEAVQAGRQVPSQGGELFFLGKSELRVPFFDVVDLAVFFELGNLWLARPSGFPLRTVAGGGVRYVTPLGPLALDVGVNLAPDLPINEPTFVVHFNIGVF